MPSPVQTLEDSISSPEPSVAQGSHTYNWAAVTVDALNMSFTQTQNQAQPSPEEQTFPSWCQPESPALSTPESLKRCPLSWGNRGPEAPLDPTWQIRSGPGKALQQLNSQGGLETPDQTKKKKKKNWQYSRDWIRSLQQDEGNEEPREGRRDRGQECLKTAPNAFRLKQAREPAAEATARKAWPHSALLGRGGHNPVHTQRAHSQINKQTLGRR